MKALSIRQPWAWLIVNGHKAVENRTWKTNVRGRILVHASLGMTRREYLDGYDTFYIANGGRMAKFPPYEELDRGGIVGRVTITDCRKFDPHGEHVPYFFGPYGFMLEDPVRCELILCPGKLGFFEVNVDA